MKIAVAGIGYVGLSNAILLSQHNDVRAVDIQEERIRMVNDRVSPVADSFMTAYLRERNLSLSATSDGSAAYQGSRTGSLLPHRRITVRRRGVLILLLWNLC